jgi:hypothetical protein
MAIVVAGLLITLYAVGHLWFQIRGEHAHALELQTRINQLEAAHALPVIAPAPAPAPALSPVATPAEPASITSVHSTPPAEQSAASKIKQAMTSSNSDGLMRMAFLQLYPDVGKELGLTKEQADRLMDVIARQQAEVAKGTLGVLSGEVADPAAVQAMENMFEDNRRAAEAEVAALLGSKYPDWQQYQATAAARLQVTRLQNALGSSNALSQEQSKALLSAFADSQGQLSAQRRSEPEMRGTTRQDILKDQVTRLEMSNQRMFDAASPILTSPQQEIYKRTLDQTSAMMRATLRMMGGEVEPTGTTH